MRPRDIPNAITVFRILLVAPLLYFLLVEDYFLALLLFAIAGVSDGIDGFLARQLNWQSRLGSILDPLADKLLLLTCFIALAWLQKLELNLVLTVIIRDVVIVLGAVAYHYLVGQYDMAPALISKLNTLCQIVLVFVLLVSEGAYTLDQQLIKSLSIVVWVSTVASGMWYVWEWGVSAVKRKKATT